MNQSVKDLTVTGKIIFPDGTFLDTSYASLFSSFLNFQRNPTLGTTTLLSDKLIISSDFEIGRNFITPNIETSSVLFTSDLDGQQIPKRQSKAFTDVLSSDISGTKQKLDAFLSDMTEYPAYKRVRISDGSGVSSTLSESSLNLSNKMNLTADALNYTDGGLFKSEVLSTLDNPTIVFDIPVTLVLPVNETVSATMVIMD